MADKVTAFEYDNATTGSDAPVSFAVIPGIWTPGEAVLPSAFGMTLEQMREAVKEFNLPLKEVRVADGKAVAEIDRGINHLATEEQYLAAPAKPSDKVVATKDGPIPAPAPAGAQPPLQPLAAAMEARNTVLANGGTLEDAAKAARDAGGRYGEGVAEAAEAAAKALERGEAATDTTAAKAADTGAEA